MIQKHHAIERVYVSVSSIFDSTGDRKSVV